MGELPLIISRVLLINYQSKAFYVLELNISKAPRLISSCCKGRKCTTSLPFPGGREAVLFLLVTFS